MDRIKFLLGLCLCFALGGCFGDRVRAFMPGTYVNCAGGEFSLANDTLVVELVEGDQYVVHRRTGFNLIADGIVGEREYEQESWGCVFDVESKTMNEMKKGKVLSFYPDSGTMKVGMRVYQKVN